MGVSRKTLSGVVGLVVVVIGALLGVHAAGGGDDAGTTTHGTTHGATHATTTPTASPSSEWIDASALPSQARAVLKEIDEGGPFEYPGKDGSVFGNYEGLLPHEGSGYYHEYTVDTPGASTRGTRRIITGRGSELYWTADHYNHFQRIRR